MNTKKSVLGIVIATIVFLILLVVPTPEGLIPEGKIALAILLVGIILWVTEALPASMTAFLLMILMYFFNVIPFPKIVSSFMSPVIFFAISIFGITIVLSKSNIPKRIAAMFLMWAGRSTKKILFGFIIATGVTSMFVSDLATCVIFMGLGLTVLDVIGHKPGNSALGKALMIGIPYASVVGGIGTPAGASLNIMAMNMLSEYAGIEITFLQWMGVGMPIAIILMFLAYFTIVVTFKLDDISAEDAEKIKVYSMSIKSIDTQDIKAAIVVGGMFFLWTISSFVNVNIVIVAMSGLVVMFLPGINLITKNEFMQGTSWDTVLMIGGVQSLAAGLATTDAAAWLINSIMHGASAWPFWQIFLTASILGAILHIIIPVGTAVILVIQIPFMLIATAAGMNPAIMAFLAAYWSAIIYLLPVDVIPLVTYSTGYYSMVDMMRVGWKATALAILIIAFLLPFMVNLVGVGV